MRDVGNERAFRVLVSALVENAMQDAAILHRAGFWVDDPVEIVNMQREGRLAKNGTGSERISRERQFWGSQAPDALLRLAASVIPLRVTRAQFVEGVKVLSRTRLGKRRAGSGGGRLKVD